MALINSVNRLTVNQVNPQHVRRSRNKWTVWQKLQPSHTATGWVSGFHVAESSKQFQSPSLKSSGHIATWFTGGILPYVSFHSENTPLSKNREKNTIWALHRYLNHWRLHNLAMEKTTPRRHPNLSDCCRRSSRSHLGWSWCRLWPAI